MSNFHTETIERIKAVIYGQCIGDAIGLLTEFMTQEKAFEHYGKHRELEYSMKINDRHRIRWETGDWTDDSDQMILLLECLTDDNVNVIPQKFATKLKKWVYCGFKDLGDKSGCGIGSLTMDVIQHPNFETDPEKIAYQVWDNSGRFSAPNGGVMRTSIMGVHQFWNTENVIKNAVTMCTVTHYDQRCKASVVAVSVAISLMLRSTHDGGKPFDVSNIIQESFDQACEYLNGPKAEENAKELQKYMFCKDIADLKLSEGKSIGYTFKCVGAGFWAFKQDNFRKAIETVVMNAGDADTNAAVAGALLGCKLGLKCFPESWLDGLLHKTWLDQKVERYLMALAQLYRDDRCQVNPRSRVNTKFPAQTKSPVDTYSSDDTGSLVKTKACCKGPVDIENHIDTRSLVKTKGPVDIENPVDTRSLVKTKSPVDIKNPVDTRSSVKRRNSNYMETSNDMNKNHDFKH